MWIKKADLGHELLLCELFLMCTSLHFSNNFKAQVLLEELLLLML